MLVFEGNHIEMQHGYYSLLSTNNHNWVGEHLP